MVVFAANARRAPPHAVGRGSLHRHRARSAAAASERRGHAFDSVPRGPRALRPVENQPTAHGARCALADLAWLSSRPTRDALHPTPLAEALFHRHRARSAAAASNCRDHRVRVPWRAAARASPRGEPADRPRSTRALADLAWLSSRPTRDVLHPTPLAEALLHRHRARSAAAASERRDHAFDSRGARARARFAPWRTGRPPTEHARAGGLGVVVFAANARRAPPHAVGRGSSSPTPRQVGGCGFGMSWPPYVRCRGPRALRPVENQPTAHGARARWRTWRGCLRGQRGTRSPHAVWPRLFFTDTAPGRRLRLRTAVTIAFDSRGARPARASPRGEPADRPRSTTRAGGLGVVVFAANARRAPPHAVGRGSSSPTPRQVGGCGFGTSCLRISTPVARGPRALRPVENRPTAHGARARWRTWRGCLRGQRATRSTPRRWPRLFFTDTAPGRRLRLRHVAKLRSAPVRATRARFAPWRTRPTAHRARARWRTWRGCLRGQRATCSTPRRWPRLFFTDTAPGRRLRLRSIVANAFHSRGARPARASPRGEPADRPRSTCALADLAWLSLRPTRDALHPTPLAEALLHRHRARSAAAVSKRRNAAFESRGARPARASPRGEPADRPRSTRALADLAWLSSRPTRDALHPTPLAEALLHRHRAQVGGCGFERRDRRVRLPWRAARARFDPWITGRPPTEHACALADLAWLSSRPTRGTLHPTPLAEALLHRHRARSAAAASKRHGHRILTSVARDPRALRPVENRPTAHGARARWRTWRGCLRGQRATRSTPRCWPRLFFTDTASGRRLRLRHVTKRVRAPVPRDPRALRPVENQADRPRSTCALADLAWLSSRQTRDALHPTLLAEALLHRHRARSAAAASNAVTIAFDSRGAQPARASPRGEPADLPRSTRALADLAWLSSRPTRDVLHPTPLAEALLHRHRARSAAAASERRAYHVRVPWRAARARFAPWRTGRPPTEHALAGGLGVVVFAANARRAPPHAVGRGSSSPTPRQVGGCGFGTSATAFCSRAARPARASPRGEPGRPPTEHARAGGLGVVVFAANARRAPPHAVGRGSSSPTPRQVGGCGFEAS